MLLLMMLILGVLAGTIAVRLLRLLMSIALRLVIIHRLLADVWGLDLGLLSVRLLLWGSIMPRLRWLLVEGVPASL